MLAHVVTGLIRFRLFAMRVFSRRFNTPTSGFTSNIYPTCTNKGNEIYHASSEHINHLRLPLTYPMKMNVYNLQMSGGSDFYTLIPACPR